VAALLGWRQQGIRDMKRSLRSWLWRIPVDQEVDEELAFHLDMRTRELIDRGVDPATARRQAAERLGDLADLKRTCVDLGRKRDRDMRLMQWLEEFRNDVTFALRQLRRAPGFAAVAVITLALGIGANSAIFALVDATLLRPLPFPAPDRLVMLWEQKEGTPRGRVSPLNLLDWTERNRSFEHIAGFFPGIGGMVMNGADGTAETIPRQWVMAGFFDVLGVKPIIGRTFTQEDNDRRANAVVMSEGLWRTRFNSDPTIVGRDIQFDGDPYTVVGVVPAGFQLFGETSIWGLVPTDRRPALRGIYALQVIGRLKPGVAVEQSRADLATVADALAREYPATNTGRGVRIEPLHDALIGSDLRTTSMLFLGVVGFVLLICCANVANLLLARATVRTRELSLRAALGAGRWRVARQLLTESLVLAALGGALGVAVGAAILEIAPAIIPQGLLPGAVTLTFDVRVVAFCAAGALLVGLLFGVVPASQTTAENLRGELSSRTSGTETGRGGFLRSALVVGEVATAVVLLFGAGLLLRTLANVENVDRGYRAERVLTMLVDPLGSRYPTPESLLQFFAAVEDEIRAVPGVQDVAWGTTLPMGPSEGGRYFVQIVGDTPVDDSQLPTADFQIVSPSYFATLDLPVVAGRPFTDRDTRGSVAVCVVNEAFVRKHLQGRSPIGVRVAVRPTAQPQSAAVVREIVGVARQVKGRPDETEDLVQLYVPLAQNVQDDIFLLVRPTSARAEGLAGPVRGAIGRIDKEQLVSVRNVMTLEDIAWGATSRHRFRAVLVMTFATLALVLAMVGVFGILAYSIQQRVRDIGVRRALGATTADVFRLVVGSTVRVIAAGAIIGLVASATLGRLVSSMLFGVEPLDPATFALVTVVLVFTAALAVAGPAWRATRIDPVAALRGD
jgi:putative ABC transport system permease protein